MGSAKGMMHCVQSSEVDAEENVLLLETHYAVEL